MSELDLLNLARSTTEHEVTWFAQMLTINFAMICGDLLLPEYRENKTEALQLLRLHCGNDRFAGANVS